MASRILGAVVVVAIATVVVSLLASPPAGAAPVDRSIVCLNTVLPALPATPRIRSLAPVSTIRSTTALAVPTTTVPNVMLLIPPRQIGAYVVPITTTMPSVPGVTFIAPQVLVPPRSVPGQNRPLIVSELIQGATGATVACY